MVGMVSELGGGWLWTPVAAPGVISKGKSNKHLCGRGSWGSWLFKQFLERFFFFYDLLILHIHSGHHVQTRAVRHISKEIEACVWWGGQTGRWKPAGWGLVCPDFLQQDSSARGRVARVFQTCSG